MDEQPQLAARGSPGPAAGFSPTRKSFLPRLPSLPSCFSVGGGIWVPTVSLTLVDECFSGNRGTSIPFFGAMLLFWSRQLFRSGINILPCPLANSGYHAL